jgi:hypothetical protein
MMPSAAVPLWNDVPMSALRHHVLGVVLQGAQEKMVRIDAGRVIAAVQHIHSLWDRAMDQRPSDTVRTTGAAVVTA